MHSSQLFVPPTLVERRRVTLSPDFLRAWDIVGWAGAGLLLAGVFDLILGFAAPSSPQDAAVSSVAERAHVLVLGVALALASGVARGRRTVTRALISVALALAIALAGVALFASVGLPAGTAALPGRLRVAVAALVYATALVLAGVGAWRHLLRHEHVPLG